MSQLLPFGNGRFAAMNTDKVNKNTYILLLFCALLVGCADHITLAEAQRHEAVGFWYGLWHGLILPVAWFISLFDSDVTIYAIYNNGGWYNFGFLLGANAALGGAAAKAKAK